jgi:hypothetical protein
MLAIMRRGTWHGFIKTRAPSSKSSSCILQINGLIIRAFTNNPSLFFSSLAGSFSQCQAKRQPGLLAISDGVTES